MIRQVIAAARRAGMPLMGHVPSGAKLEQALRWGQASIEHLIGYTEELIKTPVPRDVHYLRSPERILPESLAAQRQLLDFAKIPALAAATAPCGSVRSRCGTRRNGHRRYSIARVYAHSSAARATRACA